MAYDRAASSCGEVASGWTSGCMSRAIGRRTRRPFASMGSETTSARNLPQGTVTFLLSDVESSSRLWEQYQDAMAAALVRHDEIIDEVVGDHHGVLVRPRGEGDSRFAVFTNA